MRPWALLYFLSWTLFGAVGLALNVACLPFLPFRHSRPAVGRAARTAIRRSFRAWTAWLHATRLCPVRWTGFPGRLPTGTVYVANHPGLLDATVLLSRLPDVVCIFKPALLRHPVVGPAARLADYVAGVGGVDLVRDAALRLSAGCSLLIFPEGSRTTQGVPLDPLRPGFAHIATRAAAPVQVLVVRSSRGLLSRGRPWHHPPDELPAWIEVEWADHLPHDPARSAADLSTLVGSILASRLAPRP